MRTGPDDSLPRARKTDLVVKELPDELLVYDLASHKAHCLNKTSALVWKHCDGRTPVGHVTRLLEKELQVSVDDDVVSLALSQLRKFNLLEQDGEHPILRRRVSRRDIVSKYLPAALALPVIIAIAAPTAAQALSTCAKQGEPCGLFDPNPPCCPGFSCDGICFPS